MNILITGAKGFVGKNLTEALKCIRDGKDKTRPMLNIDDIYEYDIDTPKELLGVSTKAQNRGVEIHTQLALIGKSSEELLRRNGATQKGVKTVILLVEEVVYREVVVL